MDLVICRTPLQTMIASKVLQKRGCKNFELFYYSSYNNNVQKKYFNQLGEKAIKSYFHHCCGYSRLRLYRFIRKFHSEFYGKNYNNIYISSIDSIFIHYILSICAFNQLISFDDGSANIYNHSLYHKKNQTYRIKKLTYSRLGIKYNLESVKEKIYIHYSIYKSFKNIVDNVEYINLIEQNNFTNKNNNYGKLDQCTIFLGTTYDDYLFNNRENKIRGMNALKSYFSSTKNFFYLKHPMDNSTYFDDKAIPNNNSVAEDIIIEYSQKYKVINLIGFASSAQFNFNNYNHIKNYVLTSKYFSDYYNSYSHLLIKQGAEELDLGKVS